MTNPVANVTAAAAAVSPASRSGTAPREWGFMETLRGAMDQADQLESTAQEKTTALLSGNGMDVHSAMIAVEKADLSFQLMMQVRNKIVAAYQEISRMQF
jgi:flagellar hook-basal body complex protein FliE